MYVYIFNLKYHWYTIIVDYFFHSKPCLNFNSITNYSLYTMKILTKLQKKKNGTNVAVWRSAWVRRLIHALNIYLLSTYCVPGMVIGIWETGNKTPCPPEASILR